MRHHTIPSDHLHSSPVLDSIVDWLKHDFSLCGVLNVGSSFIGLGVDTAIDHFMVSTNSVWVCVCVCEWRGREGEGNGEYWMKTTSQDNLLLTQKRKVSCEGWYLSQGMCHFYLDCLQGVVQHFVIPLAAKFPWNHFSLRCFSVCMLKDHMISSCDWSHDSHTSISSTPFDCSCVKKSFSSVNIKKCLTHICSHELNTTYTVNW